MVVPSFSVTMGRLKDEKSQKIYVRKLRLLLVLNQSKLTSKQKKKIKKFRKILRKFQSNF